MAGLRIKQMKTDATYRIESACTMPLAAWRTTLSLFRRWRNEVTGDLLEFRVAGLASALNGKSSTTDTPARSNACRCGASTLRRRAALKTAAVGQGLHARESAVAALR